MTLRLLVLDDEPDIRRAIRKHVRPHHYHVAEASNVEEARALIAAQRFDAALIDWNLGSSEVGENGLVIANLLREAQPRCARIIVSGHSVFEMRASWQDPLQAILAFIGKPIDWDGHPHDSLMAVLRRVERANEHTPPRGTTVRR